jgi:hypothetical protein
MKTFVISLIFIFYFCVGSSADEEFRIEKMGPDYLYTDLKFFIDIDYKENSANILKIISTDSRSENFSPDFIENFSLSYLWSEEYNKNSNRNIDGDIKSSENKLVFIIKTKEELIDIEEKYIYSKYFKKIDTDFFNDNTLVLVLFFFTGWKYPKNWEIKYYNGKYIFYTEIWNQKMNVALPLLQTALFLIKIKK